MRRLFVLLLFATGCAPARTREHPGPDALTLVRSPFLSEALTLLQRESSSFAAGLEHLRVSGVRLEIGYVEDLPRVSTALTENSFATYVPTPLSAPEASYTIVILSGRLEARALAGGYPRENLVRDLALILAHEIYGHVVPLAGPNGAPCSDTTPVASGRLACAIERENEIRSELGVRLRGSHEEVDLGFLCVTRKTDCRRSIRTDE